MDYIAIIKGLREDHDMTQTQVAEYLNINQRVYSRYETGVNRMPVDYVVKLCDLYQVSADYILGRSKEK